MMQKKFCSQGGTNCQGRELFLQSSYKEDIISSMAQQVFLLDLVLIRKMVCGSSVESVPDLHALYSWHYQKVLVG